MERYEIYTVDNSTAKGRVRVEMTPSISPGKELDNALRQVLSVPKDEVVKDIAREKKEREASREDTR